MGKAKLNIWVRDKNCRVIERTGHLHIYNCLGEEVFWGWVITDGHAEVEMPPGCYIVRAGMRGGNIYSDRVIAIVGCEEHACLNLILPNFVEENETAHAKKEADKLRLLARGGCGPALALALGKEALLKDIDQKELGTAFDVLMNTANINRDQLIAEIKTEIDETQRHLDEMKAPEEVEEAKEHINLLEKTINIIEEFVKQR
jgi:hypothetical protein